MKKIFNKKLAVIIISIFILSFGLKKSEAIETTSAVPSSFDLRDKISIKVEDQGTRGTCWTFAALNTLETYLSLNGYGNYDFSEMHLECIENGFNQLTDEIDSTEFADGGDFKGVINYFSTKQGPVLESDVPYYKNNIWGERYTEDDLSFLKSAKVQAYVYECKTFKATDDYDGDHIKLRKDVKNHIMNYGAIYASIYIDTEIAENSDFENGKIEYVQNSNTMLWANHAITIIGWDDNYSKENFPEEIRPTSDGAYIALNSWGDSWGDNGIFYISYEDCKVEENMYGITSASLNLDESKLSKIYIEDTNVYNALKNQICYYTADDKNQILGLTELQIEDVYSLNFSGLKISSVKGLEIFKNCGFYDFSNCGINNLSVLDGLQDSVYDLNLTANDLRDISKIAEFSQLVDLNLSENKKLGDLSPITSLESLTWLCLNDCNITDVSKLAKINISNVNLDDESLQVELKNNNITDVSVLENANIRILMLSGNKNITKIGNLKNVRNLDLSDCNLEDVSILSELDNIEILNLDNNKFRDISILSNLNNLFDCSIKNQKITDNITITDSIENFKYAIPTVIYQSKDYEDYLQTTIYEDDDGNIIKEGIFQSVIADGAILSEDYSYITISNKLEEGKVTVTVIGGISDGTVYEINYTRNSEDSNNEKLNNEQSSNKDSNSEELNNEQSSNKDSNNEKSSNENSNNNDSEKDNSINTKIESDKKTTEKQNTEQINKNIKTGDCIAFFILIIVLAIVILTVIFIKKKNSKNDSKKNI